MKKLSLLLILATAGATLSLAAASCSTDSCSTKKCQSCSCEATSKTFFSVRPLDTSVQAMYIAGFRNERAHVRENGKGGAFDFVLFGSKSTNDKRLASYFMPDCTTVLTAGTNASEVAMLDSRHFNIFTTGLSEEDHFASTLSFEMNQSVIGLGLHYKQLFRWNEKETKGWWMSISSPITRVKNTVVMDEKITDSIGAPVVAGGPTSMTEAFNQTAWKYGKIACECPKAKTGLADIEVKLGYEMLPCADAHFACYGGLVIPTGNKAKAVYVFEPIVGNGGHVGIESGMEGGYIVWKNEAKNHWFSTEFSTNTQYLFKNKQMRSFDVKNKPWSRYQALYANKAQAVEAVETQNIYLQTPGINVLTNKVKVTPRLAHNMTTAAVFNASAFRIEVGYNLFCRQAECVKLDCPWATGNDAPAFKKQRDAIADEDTNILLPIRPIGMLFVGAVDTGFSLNDEYADHTILESDLDMQSATHPAIVTNTFHLAMGYRWDTIKFPVHIDGGASYEFAQDNNTVLDRWAVWAKAGFAF